MQGIEYIMLKNQANQIKSGCCTYNLRQQEKRSTCLVRIFTDTAIQIRINGREIQLVIKRKQYMCNDKIPHEEPQTSLHVGHVNATHHARHRHKGHTRQRSAHHTKSHHIPWRLAIASEKSVVIGITAGKLRHQHQQSEIDKYRKEDIDSVHFYFIYRKCTEKPLKMRNFALIITE